jgi:hypothetical protein
MIAWLCLSSPKSQIAHSLVLTDTFQVPRPGETELRVVESPGVTIGRSTFGKEGKRSQLEFKWTGAGGPIATIGYHLDFETDPKTAPMANDGRCKHRPTAAPKSGLTLPVKLAIIGGVAAVIGLVLFLFLRRRDEDEDEDADA